MRILISPSFLKDTGICVGNFSFSTSKLLRHFLLVSTNSNGKSVRGQIASPPYVSCSSLCYFQDTFIFLISWNLVILLLDVDFFVFITFGFSWLNLGSFHHYLNTCFIAVSFLLSFWDYNCVNVDLLLQPHRSLKLCKIYKIYSLSLSVVCAALFPLLCLQTTYSFLSLFHSAIESNQRVYIHVLFSSKTSVIWLFIFWPRFSILWLRIFFIYLTNVLVIVQVLMLPIWSTWMKFLALALGPGRGHRGLCGPLKSKPADGILLWLLLFFP